MTNLSRAGRIFYGIAIAGMGFQTLHYRDFPYFLLPPNHSGISGLMWFAYPTGIILILAGASIVFEMKARTISLLLGTVLLLIFIFYFIPYEFLSTSNYFRPIEWDNPEKELDLSCGAFLVAGCFPKTNDNKLTSFLSKWIPLAGIIFSITIISFGIDHFLYAKDVSEYVPSWIPGHLFWTYLAGLGLFGTGIAMLLRIRVRLFATLLGSMILIWILILHIPKSIAETPDAMGGELTSAFLALAYSGIAFVIAGTSKTTR